MLSRVFIFEIVGLLVVGCYSAEWSHRLVLDKNGHFVVQWTLENDIMHFQVEVATTGYIGFGFSKTGAMKGSDILTAWIHDGKVYHQDRYAEGNFLPSRDEQDDWHVTEGRKNDTHTLITFYRKLDTCDSRDIRIDESTIRLIYAYSNINPGSEEHSEDLQYHDLNRGSRSVMLLQPKQLPFAPTDEMYYWDVLSPNFTLTSANTPVYRCKVFKTPDLATKHYITKVEALITPGNEGYIHHIVFYECLTQNTEALEALLDSDGFECWNSNMPVAARICFSVFTAWAVGGADLVFPKNVGLPIGEGPPKYYLLEIHYDNPKADEDIRDTSGYRFHYTSHDRQYDAGIWMVGAKPSPIVVIPPGQESFTIVGHSNPDCFGPLLPPEGVNAMGIALHAHALGQRMKARHFRNFYELKPLGNNDNYDFNYQDHIVYPEEIKILPGDLISVECTYNSKSRKTVTFGGYTVREEMCMAFIVYYPRIEKSVSFSGPALVDILSESGITSTAQDFTQPTEIFSSLDWSKIDVQDFEHRMRYSPHISFCFNGDPWETSVITYPKSYVPYHDNSNTCSDKSIATEIVKSSQNRHMPSILLTILFLQIGLLLNKNKY